MNKVLKLLSARIGTRSFKPVMCHLAKALPVFVN